MDYIEVYNLVKTFKEKGKEIIAVDGISFKVRKGEIFGLLGPNGAGKSTTINILTGLVEKDSGTVKILGFEPEKNWEFVKNNSNVATAYSWLSDVLTIRQNLRVYAKLYGVKNYEEKINELLRLFELDDIELTIDNEALEAIAEKALARKTGARGLRSIIENLLLDSMYNVTELKKTHIHISKDVIEGKAIPLVMENASMKEAIIEITSKKFGMTIVVDKKGKVSGIITDGDLRRIIENSSDILGEKAVEVMTKNPKTIKASSLAVEALRIMEKYSITSLIIQDKKNKPKGIIHLHDILKSGIV